VIRRPQRRARFRTAPCTGFLVVLSLLFGSSLSPGHAAPAFMPTGSDIFESYSALDEPRSDLPVGALWVQGYGPVGDGAGSDNLLLVRSVSGITINRDLQLGLTLGILKLFNIDPSQRSHFSARVADLTIVRVKDTSKLLGPSGEPRIYEALRAGSITVSSDKDISLSGSSDGIDLPVLGRAGAGKKRSLTLEGRDLFIAYRVATPKLVRSDLEQVDLKIRSGYAEGNLGEFRIRVDDPPGQACRCREPAGTSATDCSDGEEFQISISKPNPGAAEQIVNRSSAKPGSPILLALPMPIADGKGGLYRSLSATLTTRPSERDAQCRGSVGKNSRFDVAFQGERLETFAAPKAPGW